MRHAGPNRQSCPFAHGTGTHSCIDCTLFFTKRTVPCGIQKGFVRKGHSHPVFRTALHTVFPATRSPQSTKPRWQAPPETGTTGTGPRLSGKAVPPERPFLSAISAGRSCRPLLPDGPRGDTPEQSEKRRKKQPERKLSFFLSGQERNPGNLFNGKVFFFRHFLVKAVIEDRDDF